MKNYYLHGNIFAMVQEILMQKLIKKHGLISVGEVGQAFDPNDHEAVGNEADTDVEKGCIIRILQRGYRLGNHLLRPARVIVAA